MKDFSEEFEEWLDGCRGWRDEKERYVCRIMMGVAWNVARDKATLAERERCALVCEEEAKEWLNTFEPSMSIVAQGCADAIRNP